MSLQPSGTAVCTTTPVSARSSCRHCLWGHPSTWHLTLKAMVPVVCSSPASLKGGLALLPQSSLQSPGSWLYPHLDILKRPVGLGGGYYSDPGFKTGMEGRAARGRRGAQLLGTAWAGAARGRRGAQILGTAWAVVCPVTS